VTPDYGAYYEEYINSLLTQSPPSFFLDDDHTPESSVFVTVASPRAKRKLFEQ
jgi:hypothetical protein